MITEGRKENILFGVPPLLYRPVSGREKIYPVFYVYVRRKMILAIDIGNTHMVLG